MFVLPCVALLYGDHLQATISADKPFFLSPGLIFFLQESFSPKQPHSLMRKWGGWVRYECLCFFLKCDCVFTWQEIRGWRSLAAVSHIGTAILSSAITTVVASIPLCLTTIQLFAKFGQILAINTAVSIFFTLSICVALLCMMSPARFRASFKTSIIAFVTVAVVYSVGAGILYVVNWKAVTIPGPAGEPLFSKP